MAWLPIGWIPPPYTSGYVLKFYQDGTTTPTNMATDNTGGTQLSDVAYDSNGTPSNGGSPFVPHIDQAFKMSLYPDQASADADSGAVWTIDNLSPPDLTDTDTDELAKVSSNDTNAGYLNGQLVGGDGITLTENNDGANETLTITRDGYAAEVSEHIRAGNMQIYTAATATTFLIDTSIVASTWESVGPTGSGADNIWTAMDVIPSTAVAIVAEITGTMTSNAAGNTTMVVYTVEGDDATPGTTNALIYNENIDADAGGETKQCTGYPLIIPLGATNQDFKAFWATTNTSSDSIILKYRGFMTD